MKTTDEIKKGLECCAEYGDCSNGCPYNLHKDCGADLYSDALAYIQQLEVDRKERDILADAYQELKRERDAAVKAMKYMAKDLEVGICCETCSHYAYDEEDESSICADCDVDSNWQWRGVQEVE